MLEAPPGGPDGPVPPKVKRSLFKNRPEWSTPDSSSTNAGRGAHDDHVSLFDRTNETLSSYDFAAETRRKGELDKDKAKMEAGVKPKSKTKLNSDSKSNSNPNHNHKHKPNHSIKEGPRRGQPSKRRRLSESDTHGSSDSDHEGLYAPATPREGRRPNSGYKASPRSPGTLNTSPKALDSPKMRDSQRKKIQKKQIIQLIESSDEDSDLDKGVPASSPPAHGLHTPSSPPIQSIEIGDDITTTRHEQHHADPTRELEEANHTTNTTTAAAPSATVKTPTPPPTKPSPPPLHDPVLRILVHSRLPDTEPLIAQRKFTQRLQQVRESWCSRQNLTPEQTEAVFLTWRGKRIFDFTTCKSLGIQVNAMGEVYFKGRCQPPGEEGSQIEMEAVTLEIMEQIRQEKERKANAPEEASEGNAAAAPAAGGGEAAGDDDGNKVEQTKVIFRSKDYDALNILVKANTKFSAIANAFRSQRKVPTDKQIFLMFEGERLDPDDKFADSEIGHMDYVDVYVK